MGHHGGGGHHASGGDSTSARPDPVAARAALERLGFAGLLLEHKRALQLTDSQVVVLTGLQGEFNAQTNAATQELDSLRAANKVAVQTLAANHDTLTAAQRDTVIQRRHVIAGVLARLQDIQQQTRQHAMALLTTIQQQQAATFESQAEQGVNDTRGRSGGQGRPSRGG
jgi:hypothetical protein